MNPWVEIAKTYGVTAAVLGAVLYFGGKHLWPWFKGHMDLAYKLLEEAHAENRRISREFAGVMDKYNHTNQETARQLGVLAPAVKSIGDRMKAKAPRKKS